MLQGHALGLMLFNLFFLDDISARTREGACGYLVILSCCVEGILREQLLRVKHFSSKIQSKQQLSELHALSIGCIHCYECEEAH